MLNWSVQFEPKAIKDLARLGSVERKRVLRYLYDRVSNIDNPRQLGAPLAGNMSGFWRYRVGDVRIIASIDDNQILILIVGVGTRGSIYR
jgi:mRNA interferase RelE/StbE